jgi:hypothetical protein
VFNCSLAIFSAAPPALLRPLVNSAVTSTPSDNTRNEAAAFLPTNSAAVPNLSSLFATFSSPSSSVNPALLRLIKDVFKLLPAFDPLIPALASVPNSAVVSSTPMPTALAFSKLFYI